MILLSLVLFSLPAKPKPINLGRLADCIAQVENNPPWQLGGVLGWTRAAWEEETGLPYENSLDYELAKALACIRLARFRDRLEKQGVRPTVEILAAMWRYPNARERAKDYGRRVGNLYEDKTKG